MSLSVSAASTSTAPVAPPANADHSKQQAALAKLLRTYTADIQKGQTPAQLQALAKQITDAAKALGQQVTLPKASAGNTNAPPSTPAQAKSGDGVKLRV